MNRKNKTFHIPKKNISYKACKPIKNMFELIMLKRLLSKKVIIICKYVHVKNYLNSDSKNNIKNIKEKILKKNIKFPSIVLVQIRGILNITNPYHVRLMSAIKNISYKDMIKNKIDKIHISLLIYPYISKEETIKMCA